MINKCEHLTLQSQWSHKSPLEHHVHVSESAVICHQSCALKHYIMMSAIAQLTLYKRVIHYMESTSIAEPTAETTSDRRTNRLYELCTIIELMIIKTGNFKLRSTFQINSRISMSGRTASLLCAGEAALVILTSSLFPHNGSKKSKKFSILPTFSMCYHSKVRMKRLALKLIFTHPLLRNRLNNILFNISFQSL